MTELFAKLQERAERAVAVETLRRIDALAAEARELKGVAIEAGPSRLTLSGRGLTRRWLSDAALRFWTVR